MGLPQLKRDRVGVERVNAEQRELLSRGPGVAELTRELIDRHGFREFIRQFWPVAEPGTPYVHGYHVEACAAFGEATLDGTILRGAVAMPPRMGKSTIFSVLLQAFQWGPCGLPEYRFMSGSYDIGLVTRDGGRLLDVIQSPLYQALWPLQIESDALTQIENSASGRRVGTTVKARRGTGWGANYQCIDDPMKAASAFSEKDRTRVKQWYTQTMGSRIDGDPEKFVRMVVMQRLHEDDLIGLCKAEGYHVLELPMGRRTKEQVWVDLLFPQVWTAAAVAKLAKELGSEHAVSAQLLQNPLPEAGGYVDRAWLKEFEMLPAKAEHMRWFQVWDLGFKGKKDSHSQVAGVLCAIYQNALYVYDYIAEHLNYPQTRRAFKKKQRDPEWARAGRIFVEDAANGPALIDDLTDAIKRDPELRSVCARIIPFPPGKLSKEERFAIQSDKIRDGRLYLRKGLDEVAQQLYRFPNSKRNDIADCVAKGLSELKTRGLLARGEALKAYAHTL